MNNFTVGLVYQIFSCSYSPFKINTKKNFL